eukprot:TRINITY_DN3082_c0_g2_i1.p1 TRINITY_DN3082_c0_g2~~TRINITY_DN3082_c0_g2_i1.p1  ORF type:complete len:490 (-),score=38.13 TRINITY_DN3082_c0_g2_i1:57-1484(-)
MAAPLISPRKNTLEIARDLPPWCRDEGALGVAVEFHTIAAARGQDDRAISLQSIAGPAVTLGFLLLRLTWNFFAILPWCIAELSTCSKLDLAQYPLWIWIVVVPCLAVAMVIENKCFGFVIIPVAQVLGGRFKIYTKDVSIMTLSLYQGVASFLNRMDIVTNGLFFGVSLKTQTCSEMMVFEDTWQKVLQQSALWWCPLSFRTLTAVSWFLMFLQPVLAILEATPMHDLRQVAQGTPLIYIYDHFERKYFADFPPCPTKYRMHTADEAYGFAYRNENSFTMYPTFTNPRGDHGSAVLSLADVNRAISLNHLRFEYTREKVRSNLDAGNDDLRGPSWGLISRELQRCLYRLVTMGLLESAVQLNLQTSWMALHKSVTHEINIQTAFSVSIGVLVSMLTIIDCVRRLKWVDGICREHAQAFKEYLPEMIWLKRLIKGACILYCLALAYVVYKLFGLWYCPDSLINLGGCVSLKVRSS